MNRAVWAESGGTIEQITQTALLCDEAKGLSASANDKQQLAEVFWGCGVVLERLKEIDRAIEFLNSSGELAVNAGDTRVGHSANFKAGSLLESKKRLTEAITAYEQALKVAKLIKDKEKIANDLARLASLYFSTGDTLRSVESFKASIALRIELKDIETAMVSTHYLAWLFRENGEYELALTYFKDALGLAKQLKNDAKTIMMLRQIGDCYKRLGDYPKSMATLNEAISLAENSKNAAERTVLQNEIGDVYRRTGDYSRSLASYDQALKLATQFKLKEMEIRANFQTAELYKEMGDSTSAGMNYLSAYMLSSIYGYARYYVDSFAHVANTLVDIGKKQEAIDLTERSIAWIRKNNLPRLEGDLLLHAADFHRRIGDRVKQSSCLDQALKLYIKQANVEGEIRTRFALAGALFASDQKQAAIDHVKICIDIADRSGNADLRAYSVQIAGMALLDDKESSPQARIYLNRSLLLQRAAVNKLGEAQALTSLMDLANNNNSERKAIFYGKAAILTFQALRNSSKAFDVQTQKSLLASMENTYRTVAHLLIRENRLAEAIQILNLMKDQEFFDAAKPNSANSWTIPMTQREASTFEAYTRSGDKLVEVSRSFADQKRDKTNNRDLEKTNTSLTTASLAFQATIDTLEIDFDKPKDIQDSAPRISEIEQSQTALAQVSAATGQKTVAIYTLVGINNYRSIIVGPDSISAVNQEVKGQDLNRKIMSFWAALQNDKYDPRILGQSLYKIIFEPIEGRLPKGTQTILWSLDGSLRYVPIAALFDGERYLIERFSMVNFTRSEAGRMTKPSSPSWTASGFGTSEAHTVPLFGESILFQALPGVSSELDQVFKSTGSTGVLEGPILRDEKFDQASFLEQMKARRPVVHIASHFSFRPGDEARSFLLMGDGSAFTLADMKKQTDMFAGVELLTLSACNTAAQMADSNGKEIDGFAEIAQRLGASAVLATLWPVSDGSTPAFMRQFYTEKTVQKLSKAESLRRAQLALLYGEISSAKSQNDNPLSAKVDRDFLIISNSEDDALAVSRSDKFIVSKPSAPIFVKNSQRPFAHPYYWAPFVLFGNWQ